MECFRIGVGGNFDVLADAYKAQIALIHVDEHPHGAGIGNGEALRAAGLQQLTGTDEALDNFACNRSGYRDFSGGLHRVFRDAFRIVQPKRTQSIRRRFKIGVSLSAI